MCEAEIHGVPECPYCLEAPLFDLESIDRSGVRKASRHLFTLDDLWGALKKGFNKVP
jgi:hypothetical protein